MEMIMSIPTQREWIRMRRDAEIDRRTEIRAAERNAKLEVAKQMKLDGVSTELVQKYTELSIEEIEKL